MKVIVAGSRTIKDADFIFHAIDGSGFEIDEMICGGAKGVDEFAIQWATYHHIYIVEFYPNWEKYGRGAGPVRNRAMADYADALIAIWDGKSRGTLNMIETMKHLGKPVYVRLYDKSSLSTWDAPMEKS